jgi:hypothetical protein
MDPNKHNQIDVGHFSNDIWTALVYFQFAVGKSKFESGIFLNWKEPAEFLFRG